MKVIVPCAGRSSRFPDMPPKWMLPDHDGVPMVVRALDGLKVNLDDVVFTLLREHEERFGATQGLDRAFGRPVRCVILEKPTSSQSETVAETLMRANISEPFLVKDSDNYFEVNHLEESFNFVTVSSLHEFDLINARNKSYLQIDQEGIVTNIREKQVISDLFSVGGYFFRHPSEFLHAFTELKDANLRRETELYVSEIIAFMMLNGATFQAKRAIHYQDWGTVHEWRSELERRRVFMVSIDGFLFQRGSRYFKPAFADVQPNSHAVETVQKMGQQQQTIIYLSIRPPQLEELTRSQLKQHNLPDGQIIFGCGVAQWSLITAPHPSLPFATSQSFEIDPEDTAIEDKINLLG